MKEDEHPRAKRAASSGSFGSFDSMQRSASSGSFGSFDSMQRAASSGSFGSFESCSTIKSVNILGLPEVGSECGQTTDDTLRKASSFPSLLHSSVSGKDLFGTPLAPQNVTTTSPTGSDSQFLPASSAKSVNKVMQPSVSSVPTLAVQQPSQTSQHAPVDMFATLSEWQSKVPEISQSLQPPPVDFFDTLSQQHSKIPLTSHSPQPSPVYLSDTLSQKHSKISQTSPTPQPPPIDLFDTLSQKLSKIPQTSDAPQPPAVDLFAASQPQSFTSSLDPFASQKQLEILQSSQMSQPLPVNLFAPESVHTHTPKPPPFDLFSTMTEQQPAESSNVKAEDVITPGDEGWATFGMLQNMHRDTINSVPFTVPSSSGYTSGNFNPFLAYPSTYQSSTGHETSALTNAFGNENIQTGEVTPWSAFGNPAGGQINIYALKSDESSAFRGAIDAEKSLSFGVYQAGAHSFEIDNKPINPFEMPYDTEMESSNMSRFWDLSSLEATLPNTQIPASEVGGLDDSWFPQNPGHVSFDSTSGSLEFMAGEATPTRTVNIQQNEGSATSSGGGGNPFA